MKNISKTMCGICLASATLLGGCIDETFPTNAATADQLASSSKATEALLWAIPAFSNNFNTVTNIAYDWGYGSVMHIRDVMTGDMPIVSHEYDWYDTWEKNMTIGEGTPQSQFVWGYYYKYIQTTNNLISVVNPQTANDTQLGYLGMAYAYRGFLYLDLARMFEFLPTDGMSSVNAAGNDVRNLTVPIITDSITEQQSHLNPRATREQMFNFILSDLNKAEEYLQDVTRPNKTLPDLSVVYGLKARLYLWVEDYANAKTYARQAIDAGNYPVTTPAQWNSTTSGFNDLSTGSWMWGSQMQADDKVVQNGVKNWTSWVSNEAQYGYALAGPHVMIDARMYSMISDNDIRKLSWKAPAKSALDGKNTYIDANIGAQLPDYAALKFRPGQGNAVDNKVGSACAYPLMRVEEMYFIEAEATAHTDAGAGKQLLESFMKANRDDSYTCKANSQEDVVNEIVFQKSIELWGEGLNFFDIKRLNIPVTRGYEGTNFSDAARFNTTGRPAWMNFCIVRTEKNNNKALMGYENPDPSGCYTPWK